MSSPPPQVILLVDGYNIIGTESSLTKTRDCHGLLAARQELVEVLINYSAFRGYKTQVVFDAHYQKTGTCHEDLTPQVSVCYTDFGQTADSYIEKFCAAFRSKPKPFRQRLIVATSDRAQRLTVTGYGAEWMSSQQLISDVHCTSRGVRHRQRPPKQSRGRFLVHSLDELAQQRLSQWRQGIR
ncbi:NYN domain-containing protein [Coleofasciculus sp. G2-EDA-02]|uniref:NYN domain-containing protein n=1 Tax=Coleofasciculus sp. G2-EDA-02 TaxID=3069529 RepID=UPI0032F2956E